MCAERRVTPEEVYKQHQKDERRVRNAIITAEENVEKAKTIGDSIDHVEVSAEYQEQAEERIADAVAKKDYKEANRLIIDLLQHREGIRQLRENKENQEPDVERLTNEALAYWTDFYQNNGYDWVTLPDKITLAPDQIADIQELMKQGFNLISVLPKELVDDPVIKKDTHGNSISISNHSYERLHQITTQGNNPTFTGSYYELDGHFQGSKDEIISLRIFLTKDVQNIGDDKLHRSTINLSVDQLEKDPRFSHLLHLSESGYLVIDHEYFKRTGKHLDEKVATWLPGSVRPLSGRVPNASWDSEGGRLNFDSDSRGNHDSGLGCRLAGSFEVKI